MRDRIGALDGWRGIAVLLVLVDHAGEMTHARWLHAATRTGATGVGIFFALSGYLITTLLLGEQRKTGAIRTGGFYVRRAFRILPALLAYLGALALLRAFEVLPVTGMQLVSPILLFRNYLAGDWGAGWYTGHLWSLMVEAHFYLLWPLLLVVTRGNLKVLTAMALSVAAWREVSLHYHLLPGPWAPGRTDLRLDALLWGCILAIALSRPEPRAMLARYASGWVMLALVLVDVVSNLAHGQHYYSAFEPPILALLVVWPVLHPESALRRVLDGRALGFAGAISYSVYLWQQLWMLFPGAPMPFPALQTFPANVAMAVICGIASYYIIEKPGIELGRRLIASASRPKTQPVPAL